jgi:STE24 endopeptidase
MCGVRLGLLLVLLAAAAATWLWHAELPPDVPAAAVGDVFTPAEAQRARDYRGPQRLLQLAALALPVAAGVLLARRWRRGVRVRPPIVAAAATAAAFALAVQAAALPVLYVMHRRAGDVGLDRRGDAAWAGDVAIAAGGFAAAVAVAYTAAFAMARRSRRPWLHAGLAAWGAVAVLAAVQPLLLDPLLMDTRAVAGRTRALVDGLERRLGVEPASVTVSDASTRTSAENAFVDGLGPTERVVLFDTALRGDRGELRALVAHELAHLERGHLRKGVAWFGVIALPALLLVGAAVGRLGGDLRDPRSAPLVLAAVLLAWTCLLPVTNVISRRYEAEADWVGLRATGDVAGMTALERRLALANLSDPDPPAWSVWLLATHPPVTQRVANAQAYSRSSAPRASPRTSGRFLIPSWVRHFE